MILQLRHNFQACQAVHGADDITTPIFYSQINSVSVCNPQVDETLIYYRRLKPYSFVFV